MTSSEEEGEEQPEKEETVEAKQEAPIEIKRGFFAEGDLGVFFSLGGRNTNSVNLTSRTFSNVQPYVGLTLGYDVFHTDSFNLGLGLRFAMGLNGGAGRASVDEPLEEANTKSNDYSVQQAGAAINFGFLVAERLALTFELHGGAGFLTPDPTLPAAEAGAGGSLFAPTFGGAIGLELYTLLNDFSIGILVRSVNMIASGEFIPGLSATIPIKYTF